LLGDDQVALSPGQGFDLRGKSNLIMTAQRSCVVEGLVR
jgi:hypothetical protein